MVVPRKIAAGRNVAGIDSSWHNNYELEQCAGDNEANI